MTAALFVLAGPTVGQQGPVAALLSTAGWASAARRVLGDAWIVTPTAVLGPDEARRRGSAAHLSSASAPTWAGRVPVTAKTAVKDVLHWRRMRATTIDRDGPWGATDVAFVWQRHELFHTGGLRLARELGVPSVLFVTAPQVWEARQWGVRRPGWDGLLERRGDLPPLHGADLVACGTSEVADAVVRLGVDRSRVLITPTGVDLDVFAPGDGSSVREALGLRDRFVVGWMGSFRRFHAVESAVRAVADVPGAALLLVGDGPERPQLEQLAHDLGVDATFTGTVPHEDLPRYLAAMDTAVITASPATSFHYSPLKLAEYLAAARPVVAPRVGQIAERLVEDVDALLYEAGDVSALAAALRSLRDDPDRRAELGAAARTSAEREWSWDRQVERITAALR